MSFESAKAGAKIPTSFSSPEFAGPAAHEVSVMSTDSTMDSIATNVSSSIAESRIVKSVNSHTHDSGFGDSLAEDASFSCKKLVARAEHSITVSSEAPGITLTTRIDSRDKSKLKSVEEDMDVKQTDDQVITIVKTTKLTTKVERVNRNKKKRKSSKKSHDSKSSEQSCGESADDSNHNQSESLVYQVDINKSTEELVYQTMSGSEAKPTVEPVLDLNSTVLDCEEILSNYSAGHANNASSPTHLKMAESAAPPAEQPLVEHKDKKVGFFRRFRSREKEPAAKRKLELKPDCPLSPSKHFKPAKHYAVHKYELLSAEEKERVLYMKEQCVDLVIEGLAELPDGKNVREMVSRSLDLLRHDRIESFDKLALEIGREYSVANGSVFNEQMKRLIVDEKCLLGLELDKSRKPCEELIEFAKSGHETEETSGANLNSISANLIRIKESERSDEASRNEMDNQAKEKCRTPPSTPQNELGCGDGTRLTHQAPSVRAADLNEQILTKVADSTVHQTSVQAPSQHVNRKPKRTSTLSSCFTCAGVLKLSDDESRPTQQQMDKKKVVESRPNELEVAVGNSAPDTIVHTALITHDLDKRPSSPPQQINAHSADIDQPQQALSEQSEEKFIALDTDDSASVAPKSQHNDQVNELVDQDEQEVQQQQQQADSAEVVKEPVVGGEEVDQAGLNEKAAKKSKNKKKKKKKKNKDKNLDKGQQSEINEPHKKMEHESTPEDDGEVSERKEDWEKVSQEQKMDEESDKEKSVERKESVEEETEIKVTIETLRENETKDAEDQQAIAHDLTKQTDAQLEVDCQRDTNIQVIETLRVITERVVQQSQPVQIQITQSQIDDRQDQQPVDLMQEIQIDKEQKWPVETNADLYKPASVQQNDPVVLPEPRQRVMPLAVDNVQVESSSEPVAVKEAESEEDASKISCFSCRGKKAAKKSKGPKKPIQSAPPAATEILPPRTQPIEPRPVDVSFFVGLDNTDKKLDTQSSSSGEKKQTVQDTEETEEMSALQNVAPSLVGSTSIEQPGAAVVVDADIKRENDEESENRKEIVVEVIYESKQEEPNRLEETNESLDQVQMEHFENKSCDQLLEPIVIEIEKVDLVKSREEEEEEKEKPKLSDDPVVLPDPTDRPIAEIVEATPVIQPPSQSIVEQTPKLAKNKSDLACCGAKKRKSKKSKKTSKIDLPIVKILAPKSNRSHSIKVEQKPEPEQKAQEQNVQANDAHELARVQKAPAKDWAKGLDRTQSTELIRREPQVSDVKITDNRGEQLTNVTIEIAPDVDMHEIKVTQSESVKISDLETVEVDNGDDKTTQSSQPEDKVEVGNKDTDGLILPTSEIEDRVVSEEICTHADAKPDTKDLIVKTNLTFESPGAIIRINREPDHAVIPDHTKDRVAESVVEDQSEAREETPTDTGSSSKATGKKGKKKKTKRTSRIDLPLINILVPKQDKTAAVKQAEANKEPSAVRLEQNVAKVVNLGNDLHQPIQLVEKDTTVDINIPKECELKNVDISLKIDTAEVKQVPEINIAVSQYSEQAEKRENIETETETGKERVHDPTDKEQVEIVDISDQPKEFKDEEKEEKMDVVLPPLDITVPDIKQINLEPESKAEEKEDKMDVILPPLDITVPDIKQINLEPESKAEEKEDKMDVVLPPLDITVPDIKQLDHEPDVVVLPEVDLSARVQEIEQTEKPSESSETKIEESKKSKKKKKRTSKIDLPLVDIFAVKEAKNQSAKADTNIYVDMPVVDLVPASKTTRTKDKKETVSCFACKSKKSKKSKLKSESEPASKQIPKIIEPVQNEQEINKAIEELDQKIDRAETSNLTDIIKEAEQSNEINVTPLIVIDYNETNNLETKEKNDEEKDTDQMEHESTPEDDGEVSERKEDWEKVSQEQKMDEESDKEKSVERKESVEEETEIKVTIETLRENETKDAEDQQAIAQDLTKQTDAQLEVDCQRDTNIQVIETLRERVVQQSQPVQIQITQSQIDDRQDQQPVDLKQEIQIDKEQKWPVETNADLYKPASVQQNDPVVLPEPRQRVMPLAVDNVQVESSSEPVAVKEAESEEDASKISCFSCRGKKAAKKSKGPKQPVAKPHEPKAENVPTETNLTPQIKSVNLDLFKGLDKPSSLSEMEKAIDYSDLSVVPRTTIVEKQNEENSQQVPQSIQIDLASDLTSALDLPPSSPTRDQIAQVKSEMEQMLEPAPAPVPETQIPTIKINETFASIDSPPLDFTTPPKKPPRGHLDSSVLDQAELIVDQTTKMNVKEALVKVNTPGETAYSNDTPTKREKKHKTSIIDLPLIDILVPKESKKSRASDNLADQFHIEPKGTSIELNQPEVELFIEKGGACNKQRLEAINLSSEDKKLLKAKRNEICEYLKQRSGYKLEQLVESTSQTTSKKELKAREKMADKLYKRSIKLMTKTRVNPISFSELSRKLEKVVSAKSGASDIEKCVGQIRSELESDTLFSCLREKSEQRVEKKEENVQAVAEPEVENQESKVEPAESRKSSLNSEISLRCPNLSWREANERARILFYKGQTPSIHYNEKRDSFHVSRLVNASDKEKVSQVPVTDDDVKKLLNSYGLYWNGESIDLLDKSDEIFTSAQQEAFDILNSIQVSESIQITENHCETVEQSKINYIY